MSAAELIDAGRTGGLRQPVKRGLASTASNLGARVGVGDRRHGSPDGTGAREIFSAGVMDVTGGALPL